MAAPADRVQLLKQESSAGGGDAADEEQGFPVGLNPNEDAPEVRGVFLQGTSGKDELVYVTRDPSTGDMLFADNVVSGEKTLTQLLESAAGGITEGEHEDLDTLVHEIAETCYMELTRSSGKVVNITYWTDSGKTTKVRETVITRSAGKVSQVVETQFDAAGTAITGQTITLDITRTGGKIASIDLTES